MTAAAPASTWCWRSCGCATATRNCAAIDRLELRAPTLAAALWHMQSVQLQGLRAIATQTPEGLHLPGLLLQNRTPAADAATAPTPAAAEPAAANTPRAPLPALRLDQCEIACQQFVFRDRRGPELEPFVLTGSVQLQQPWATAVPLVDSPPLALLVTATAPPCAGKRAPKSSCSRSTPPRGSICRCVPKASIRPRSAACRQRSANGSVAPPTPPP